MNDDVENCSEIAILKFNLNDYEAKRNIQRYFNLSEVWDSLYSIQQECRNVLKYDDTSKSLEQFAEKINELAYEAISKIDYD